MNRWNPEIQNNLNNIDIFIFYCLKSQPAVNVIFVKFYNNDRLSQPDDGYFG
jgi:hypothetical protein